MTAPHGYLSGSTPTSEITAPPAATRRHPAAAYPTIQPDTSRAMLGAKLRVAQAEVDQQARIGCRLLVEGKLDLALMHAMRAEEAQLRVNELAAEIRGAAADRQAALA